MTAAAETVIDMPEPFDLRGTLRPWAMGDASMRFEKGANRVAKAARLPSGPVAMVFEQEDMSVTMSAWGPGADEALTLGPSMLGASDDPSAFEPADPDLARLAARHRGVRQGRAPSIIEVLINTIIQQLVTTREATDSIRQLVRLHSEDAPGPLGLRLPPDPKQLARLPYYEYHPLGIEKRRADVVRYVGARPKRIAALGDLDIPEATRRLASIRGVGPWTIGLVSGIALGDPDAVPTGDYHLPSYVSWALAGEPRADDERMLELLAPYAGQRWRVIRLIRLSGITAPRFGPRKGPAHWNRRR